MSATRRSAVGCSCSSSIRGGATATAERPQRTEGGPTTGDVARDDRTTGAQTAGEGEGRDETVVGAILCGGRSRRFGSDKALADVGGRPLASTIVDALRAAGADPVAAIGGTAGDELGIPTIPDRFPAEGPLGGLATALTWVKRGSVLVTPCDLPLLRADDLLLLIGAARTHGGGHSVAAVATVDGRPQPSVGCWPADQGLRLIELLNGGQRAWRAALEVVSWIGVELPADALADADTPEELEALLGRRPPPGQQES